MHANTTIFLKPKKHRIKPLNRKLAAQEAATNIDSQALGKNDIRGWGAGVPAGSSILRVCLTDHGLQMSKSIIRQPRLSRANLCDTNGGWHQGMLCL